MSFTRNILLVIFIVSLGLTASAQVAHVLTPSAFGATHVAYLPSPAYVFGKNRGDDPLPFFWSFLPTAPTFGGGLAIDQIKRRVYATNGDFITEESMGRFAPGAPSVGPIPVPIITPGLPGFITGLSMDGKNRRLIMTDEWSFRLYSSVAPYNPIGPVITPPLGHSQFTGVAYDPSDDTLWFCGFQGGVYHTKINGDPIPGEYPIVVLPNMLQGIAVDRSEGAGTAAAIFQNPNLYPAGRPRVWVTDGNELIDPITFLRIPTGLTTFAYGMAFSADGQFSGGGSVALATGLQPVIRQKRPSANGFGMGTDILLEAAPAWTASYLFYGWFPRPGFGIGLGFLRVWDNHVALGLTSPGGTNSARLPDVVAGLSLSFQYLVRDPAGGAVPWALSDCLTFMSARP